MQLFLGSSQVRHGAGTGLREILKAHGRSGGKMGDSTLEEVSALKPQLSPGLDSWLLLSVFGSNKSNDYEVASRST